MSGKKLAAIIGILFVVTIVVGAYGGNKLYLDSQKKPEIILTAGTDGTSPDVTLHMGETYEEPGFVATGGDGRDLTDAVETTVPEMSETGIYTVEYQVTDTMGNVTTAERKVDVQWPAQTKAGKKRGLAVLMYHDVYDPDHPPASVNANMISSKTLEEELQYLVKEKYYFPTWKEVRQYLDGEIDLPEKSIVLTFDDATKGFIAHGAPLLEKYDVRATSFVIGSKNGETMAGKNYQHIDLESHSYNMHRPGGNIGHGGVMTALSDEERLADLKKSQKQTGHSNAFAYPFGDYNKACQKSVEEAGFLVAFTTNYGKIYPGDNPYLLSRVRINGGISLETFKQMI